MTTRRVALITGGTDGIGKATAKKLFDEGWEVAVVGRNPARCAATVTELGAGEAAGRVSAIVAALGYLSRALMAQRMEAVLAATPSSQILTLVGLNKSRLDFDDLTLANGFKGMTALGRWQWAMQVYAREWNARSPVPMNIYMPGIVKTKILDSEPSLVTRTMIKAVYAVKAVSADQSAGYVAGVLRDVEEHHRRDVYYSVKTLKPRRELGDLPGDQEALWELTRELLQPYLQPQT